MPHSLLTLHHTGQLPDHPGLQLKILYPEAPQAGTPGRVSGDAWYQERLESSGLEAERSAILSMGLGEIKGPEAVRQAGGKLATWLLKNRTENAWLEAGQLTNSLKFSELQAFFEGLILSGFRFRKYRTTGRILPVQIAIVDREGSKDIAESLARAQAIAGAVNLARLWGHEPPNVLNPVTLTERLKDLAKHRKLKIKVLGTAELEQIGAGALLATGAGSRSPPCLVIIEHNVEPGSRPIVLAGKAITFDSGGYTLKTRASMVGMKYDKSGGLAVAGIMDAIAALNLDRPVVGIIAAAENMVSANAYRPNDIVTSLSGKTIEVISTDAEGRMVLADALTYASTRYEPAAIIDFASLTSGVVTTLGRLRAGLFSKDKPLAQALLEAGERTHERLWQFPLDDEYLDLIKGDDSDLKNSSLLKQATAVVGAKFLEQFVLNDIPWAHLDIAGTHKSATTGPYSPKGATGFGVRLMVDFLEGFTP